MFRKLGLLAAALWVAGAPVAAQQEGQAAFTPEEDLDCVIYIGALMAETEVEMTPESRLALSGALTYFVGRYEAQRGTPLAQALAERYPLFAERNVQEVEQTCSLRARGFAMRLQDAGRSMAETAPARSDGADASPGE